MKDSKRSVVLTILFLMLFLVLLTGCSKKIELSDYTVVEFDGIDGKGTAIIHIEWSRFEKDITENKEDDLSTISKKMEVTNSIRYSLDQDSGLKNGDVVTLQIKFDSEIAKKYKLKFSGKDKTFTVSGLPEAKVIDVFEGIKLNHDGVSPYATAQILNQSNDPFIKSIQFEMDHNRDIRNGDVITVTANYSESQADKYLYVVKENSKTFTASGLDEYTPSHQTIDQAARDKIDKQSLEIVEATLADQYKASRILHPGEFIFYYKIDKLKIIKIEKLESYYLTIKEGLTPGWNQSSNVLFEVYQVEFKDEQTTDGGTVYVPVVFKNLIQREGKTDVVITDARVWDTGFNNYDNLVRDLITVNKSNYDHEIINE